MRLSLILTVLFSQLQLSPGMDVPVADTFIVSLPDTAKEQIRSQPPSSYPPQILPRYGDTSFQLSMYLWPNVKPSASLKEIPTQWAKDRKWASVSDIQQGKTNSGIPYVTFNVRMVRDERPPFESVMTVLRSPDEKAIMFQMTGDSKVIDEIRKSIKNK